MDLMHIDRSKIRISVCSWRHRTLTDWVERQRCRDGHGGDGGCGGGSESR